MRILDLRSGERRPVFLAGAYFFLLLAAYYIIRPLREEMGVAGGVQNLAWLFTGTLAAMLLLHAPFAALVARVPRRRFVTVSYRFFLANILAFYLLLGLLSGTQVIWVGRVFFVWTSVFNLFAVSVFWAVVVDVFDAEQGKRLFGAIALGGTLGASAGAGLTALLASRIGPVHLLLGSAVLLEASLQCMRALTGAATGPPEAPAREPRIGGSALSGVTGVFRSPYLLGICAYMLLFTLGSTVLYFHQARFAEMHFPDRALRTAFFARIDFVVNLLTALTQGLVTARLIRWFGVAAVLAVVPAITLLGFTALGAAPLLVTFVVVQVLRRSGEYALGKPTRELLFTVVSREAKYKAKNFIDTFVYRSGDQLAAWTYTGLAAVGLGVGAISWLMVPVAGLWMAVAIWLGRREEQLAHPGARPIPGPRPASQELR